VSNNIVIITLDDNSVIYSDIKIPENYSASIKKGLPVEVKITSYKNKIFKGEVDFVSSRINADTRSLLARIKIDNKNLELISGSLLEVGVKFDLRNSLSVPDTSVMIEGDKSFVYKINEENIANKTEIKTGIRTDKSIEIISGLTEGDVIVAEGLKKVRPLGKIKPINK
jgi:membrane fusion protein (multidrug efflux system)